MMSGRKLQNFFEDRKTKEVEHFNKVVDKLKEKENNEKQKSRR